MAGLHLFLAKPVLRHRLPIQPRYRGIEAERLLEHAAKQRKTIGKFRIIGPRFEGSARFGGRLFLERGLFGEEEKDPGHGIGGGLMAGKVEGGGIVHRQRERVIGLEPFRQGADEAAEEILLSAVRQPVANHLGPVCGGGRSGRAFQRASWACRE